MRIKHAIYTLLSLPFIVLIKGYQLLISPLLGQNCRFYPSCSQYAHQAIKIHGPVYGCWLSIVRISKCHPLNEGGIDNVPTAKIKFKKFKPLAKTNLKIGLTKEKPNNLY